jgi:membrane protease YdiL (CAAX protease family)
VVPPLLFVFYGWGTGTLRLQGLVLYSITLLPLLVAAALEPPRDLRLRDIQTYGTLLVLWLVVEFRAWFPFFPYPGSVGGTLFILFGVMHGAWIFLLLRPMEGTGYALDWSRAHSWQIGLNFALIALLVIPLGQAIGFLRFDPSLEQLRLLPLTAAGIFLFNAWPEEFFFRGLLQNQLARTLRNEDLGWVAASVLFGLAHLNNGRFPNWRYAVLATVAGLFYGRTWRRTGSVFAAAVVHTAVNAAWRALFRTL